MAPISQDLEPPANPARFIAISEFGPQSLVYHEGRAYRVDRALLKEAGGGPEGLLPTFSVAVCPACGAGHDGEAPEECHVCHQPLSGADLIQKLHRIDNVGTRQAERITANDEDRRRQGFELQTTFSFLHASGVSTRILSDDLGDIVTATFAPAASVRRINKGLRRRKDLSDIGFWIDPKSGYWAGAPGAQDDEEAANPTKARQKITPVVEDRKNALLVRFPAPWLIALGDQSDVVMTTLQHALARGIETVFQLEEGEILVEPTPSKDSRNALFFYEAAEGGAGALSRLINEQGAFNAVSKEALSVMHYTDASVQDARGKGPEALVSADDARCVAGCYRCLLSYFNQPDHEQIDRQDVKALDLLIRLMNSRSASASSSASCASELRNCPAPDADPLVIGNVTIQLIWRKSRVAAVEAGLASGELSEALKTKGVRLVVLSNDPDSRKRAIVELEVALKGASA